jgi:hypothetical protein
MKYFQFWQESVLMQYYGERCVLYKAVVHCGLLSRDVV